jgi:Transposase DDE domain
MSIRHKSIQGNKKLPRPTQTEVEQTISEDVRKIKSALSKRKIDKIATETGFVKRSSARLLGKDFLVTLLMESLDPTHSSLEKISSTLTVVNREVQITPQSIMERINSPAAVDFCQRVQESALNELISPVINGIPVSYFSHFSKVYLQDSTVFELHEDLQELFKGSGGRSSKSCVKIDVVYDILEKQYAKFTITDQRDTDSILASGIDDLLTKNSLVIRDLGYLRADGLETIMKKSGYFLSRLKANFCIFLDPNSVIPTEVVDCFRDEENMIDLPIYVTNQRLPARLIAYRAPQAVIDKRKRVAHATARKQGKTVGARALKLMEFTVYITNVPPEIWPVEVVGTIYAIRWQIELLFKNWKTGMGFHYIKGINKHRIKVLIHIRLLLMIIINRIYRLASELIVSTGKQVSMWKVFAWMRDKERLRQLVKGTLRRWEMKFFLKTVLICMCQQNRTRKTTMQAICEGVSFEKYCA